MTTTMLDPAHAQQLASSAINDAIIAERGYRSIAPAAVKAVRDLTGGAFGVELLKRILHRGALTFPIYRLGDPTPYTWVLRPDLPRSNEQGKPVKYEYPRGCPNAFDLLPSYHDALNDPTVPIWLTEGAKKADALASAFGDRILPINLNGVWGWRGRGDKGGKAALPDMELIAWEGRQVVIAPDGDVKENRNVAAAVKRLARLLSGRYAVADLRICYLPHVCGESKTGIDDYLAAGHTTQDLDALLIPLDALDGATIPFGVHPETGANLMLPAGYDVRGQSICMLNDQGSVRKIYSGAIFVAETGADLLSGERQAVIGWNGRADDHGELTVPYASLSDPRAFGTLAGGHGAALGPTNIRDVMQFLVEFVQENRAALPHRAHADRYGLVSGGVVTPAGAVGFTEDVKYTGRAVVAVGKDAGAYPAVIRQALSWQNADAFWLTLALSLAGPVVARMRPRRNPVLYLSGASGSGKTTIVQLATGCWGAPMRHPLRLEAGRTTPAGLLQTLEQLNGLPAFVDEAHTIPDPKRIEMVCYSFANGQRYTYGTADQKGRGGGDLYGTLLLAGEAIPEFKHAGANLRVLWADAGTWLPMGAEPNSRAGEERARLLESAWDTGAGLFGLEVTRRIWADWSSFVAGVRVLETDPALAPLQAWRQPLAIAAAALNVAFQAAGVTTAQIPDPAAWIGHLLDQWATMLTSGHDTVDPATEAWESLVTMLVQGRHADDGRQDAYAGNVPAQWDYIEADRSGGVIACRHVGDDYWRVLTTTPQFKERVGAQAVQLYGQTWVKRGWVTPGPDGKATHIRRVYPTGLVRALAIPEAMLNGWA